MASVLMILKLLPSYVALRVAKTGVGDIAAGVFRLS